MAKIAKRQQALDFILYNANRGYMTTITRKNVTIETCGQLPCVGDRAPDFTLTNTDLEEVTLASYQGNNVILNIFPSIDTPTCATSVRKFNVQANQLSNTKILCISADLPFAQKRFCGIEQLDHVIPLSSFRHPEFGKNYGVTILTGLLKDLLSRAIVIINPTGTIIYTEQVPDLGQEPDYISALHTLK